MKYARSIDNIRHARRAFSILELLVVVTIIAVLAAILLPVVTKAREQARRAVCAANLQQLGGMMRMYARDNNDWLPANWGHELGYLMWDIPMDTRNVMKGYGFNRNLAYCPSNQEQNKDVFWAYANDPNSGLSVTGYFWMIPRTSWGDDRYNNPGDNVHYPNQQIFPHRFQAQRSSEWELMSDAVLSYNNSCAQFGWAYGSMVNHYKYGTVTPEGGNVLFHDGHVSWRDFSAMYSRYYAGSNGLGSPGGSKCGMQSMQVGVPCQGRIDQWW